MLNCFHSIQMQVQEKIHMVDGGVTYKTYTKIKDIGQGSFSKVWLVEASGSNKTYALKIITKKQMKILENERLVQEVKVHQSLTHPHIVYLDHCFEDEDYKYILLEYCEKGTLDHLFGEKIVEEEDIRTYGRQMAQALAYLHSKRILHRDLKLSNFFVDGDDNIKLGDFGFACKLQYEGELRRQTCGTPNYIAPEVIGGFGYSFPSDVWSFGAILYKLKFSVSPFESNTLKQTLQNVKLANYSFPKKTRISAELQDLISQILCVNYDDRPTLQQIKKHPFFTKNNNEPSQLKKQGSFSNFFSRLLNRSKSKSKKQTSLHKMGSCNNLRDMKTILREKTSTIDEDAYYNTAFKPETRTTFLSPPTKLNIPSPKVLKQIPKIRKLLITQFYSGVIPHQIVQQKQYSIVYLTNGLRQIINEKNTVIVSPENEYFGKDGKKCQPSKIMLYISKTYLKPSPIQCPNLKLEFTHKNFITDWKNVNQYLIMTIGTVTLTSLPKQKLIYTSLKQVSYLYNRNLEVVVNEELLNKISKMHAVGTPDITRVKSPCHKKLLS